MKTASWLPGLALALVGMAVVGGDTGGAPVRAATPPGYLSHVFQPTDAVVLPDGRMLVLEKQGVLKLFPDGRDAVPTRLLDLTAEVWSFRDFGAMALAVSPTFETDHTIYLLYDRDAFPVVGSITPEWGRNGVTDDVCPNDLDTGCTTSGRLVSMTLSADNKIGDITTVLDNGPDGGWCFQFDGHGVDDLLFDNEGALLVSAGDGARSDAGDTGTAEVGAGCGAYGSDEQETEGGALRARDVLTPSAYTSWNGSVLRIDPRTGAAFANNVLAGGVQPSDDRVVAMGLRNPFRMSLTPDGSYVYIGEVGANGAEEIVALATALFTTSVQDFQWPCLEGQKPSLFPKISGSPLCGRVDAVPTSLGLTSFTYGDLPVQWCSGDHLAVIGGAVFVDGSDDLWYVFADWARSCMLALPINADHTLDLAGAEALHLGVAPARMRNEDGRLMIVDVAQGVVRIVDEPLFAPKESSSTIGRWLGRTVLTAIVLALVAIVIVRRRAARTRRRMLEPAASVADVSPDASAASNPLLETGSGTPAGD